MTQEQWETLLAVIQGERVDPLPVGFIIDSPWLPNWAGTSILDYFASDDRWLEANFKAINEFPEIMFLPGFWSEYGMCTEPSALGPAVAGRKTSFLSPTNASRMSGRSRTWRPRTLANTVCCRSCSSGYSFATKRSSTRATRSASPSLADRSTSPRS